MNSERSQPEGKFREQEQTIQYKGTTIRIDRSSIVYRDSHMNAVYAARKISKTNQQTSTICIKEYSGYAEKQEITSQQNNIRVIQKLQLEPPYSTFFQDFIFTQKGRNYLIMEEFKQTLMDRHQFGCKNIKYDLLTKKVEKFSLDISNLLLALHKPNQQQKCLILTTLKPLYLIARQQTNYMLTNFSNLVMASAKDMSPFTPQQGEGIDYYSPEMLKGKICNKSNIWSFGCILFEMLANGEKLIQSQEYYKRANPSELANYIKRRIRYCQHRLDKLQEMMVQSKNTWLAIAQNCLQVDVNTRYSAQELRAAISETSKKVEWVRLTESERIDIEANILYEISFEYFRVNLIQEKIFAIFDQIYAMQATTHKYLYYVAIKFIAVFFLQNYLINKEKAQVFSKVESQDRYSQFLSINQWKKVKDIKDKISDKIAKWMQVEEKEFEMQLSRRQALGNTDQPGQMYIQNRESPISDDVGVLFDKKSLREDIKVAFAEHRDRKVYETHHLLVAYCYKYSQVLEQNKKIYCFLAEVLLYTRSLVDHSQLVCMESELRLNLDVLALRKMYPFFTKLQKEAKKDPKTVIASFYKASMQINRFSGRRMREIKQIR